MFQGCLKMFEGVSMEFKRCAKSVSRVLFQECFQSVSRIFQGCFKGVLRVFRECLEGVCYE